MSRKLLCPECDKSLSELAARFNELYESVEGKSKDEFLCDGCANRKPIHKGDTCFAAVLLPNTSHFQYRNQKPGVWMNDYIIPEKVKA